MTESHTAYGAQQIPMLGGQPKKATFPSAARTGLYRYQGTKYLMSETLSLNKIEKLIELESQLRGEYQQKLDEKDASIADLQRDKAALKSRIE